MWAGLKFQHSWTESNSSAMKIREYFWRFYAVVQHCRHIWKLFILISSFSWTQSLDGPIAKDQLPPFPVVAGIKSQHEPRFNKLAVFFQFNEAQLGIPKNVGSVLECWLLLKPVSIFCNQSCRYSSSCSKLAEQTNLISAQYFIPL